MSEITFEGKTYYMPVLTKSLSQGFVFLRWIRSPEIWKTMTRVGMTEKDVHRGWSLAQAASEIMHASAAEETPFADRQVFAWYSEAYEMTRASLAIHHVDQEAFVFANLEVGTPLTAIVNAKLFIDRLTALENSPERKASRKADHAALATLEQRGVRSSDRKQMLAIIDAATRKVEAGPQAVDATPALVALHEWVTYWSGVARAAIKRRELLVRLGVVRPRASKSKAVAPAPPKPVAPVVPVAPAAPVAPRVDDDPGPQSRAA